MADALLLERRRVSFVPVIIATIVAALALAPLLGYLVRDPA
jgi:hypothetical protein